MRPQVKSTIIWSILGLSLALNAALAIGVLRGPAVKTAPPAAQPGDSCLLDRLNLDPQQRRQLAEMRRRMHEKRTAYGQRTNAIKSALAAAICAAPLSRATLDAQLQRYVANQATIQRAVAEHLLGVSAMLRPEQRDGFRNLLRTEMFRGLRRLECRPTGAQ